MGGTLMPAHKPFSWTSVSEVLYKPMPDIDVVQKILLHKSYVEDRYKKEFENINNSLKKKYVANVLYIMWELITTNKDIKSSFLIPIDKNGELIEYKCGRYFDFSSLEFSKNGRYVRAYDSWGSYWIFPVEVFKYPNNFRKMKSIYLRFLKQRAYAELPKQIEKNQEDFKYYNGLIKKLNHTLEVLKTQLDKYNQDTKLTPISLEDIGFEDKNEAE